jgi:hypothetical protein
LHHFVWSLWNGWHLANLFDLSRGLDSTLTDADIIRETPEIFEVLVSPLPFFREKFRGPTRRTAASLTSQSLLKDTKGQPAYLWTTLWEGPVENVQGSFFENALVDVGNADTEAILNKLDSFGKRDPESVFEVVGMATA